MNQNKVVLLILDGWGIGKSYQGNAIELAKTPFIDSLKENYPSSQLLTHGQHVGLPDGQMGNSEVGHINIGAGRIVFQELQRINNAIASGDLANNETLKQLIHSKKENQKIHLLGLMSDGGVHSHINHFKGLVDILHQQGLKDIYIHGFTDGRDTDPKGGLNYLADLEESIAGKAEVASIIGRYYAMDRDTRWERSKLAYDLLTKGVGQKTENISSALEQSYRNDVTDEFVRPILKVDSKGNPKATIKDGDIVLFVNFRTDRPRQLTEVLTQTSFPEQEMEPLDLDFYTMTAYKKEFVGIKVIFEKSDIKNTVGEIISKANKNQIRIAETEKYPHVTFFFNGGREVEFEGEERIMINSPKVATYDLQPEMSAFELTDRILPKIKEAQVDFICLNFANADMVGHTGVIDAAIKACETVDQCVERIVTSGLKRGYQFLITADHGNSDYLINEDGTPNTAHTTNPVPLYYVANNLDRVTLNEGILADLAPTILQILKLEQPIEMTGKSLLNLT